MSTPTQLIEPTEADGSATEGTQTRKVRSWAIPFAERYALVLLCVLLFLFFSELSSTGAVFPTLVNMRTLAQSQAVTAIVALAALVPLVAYQFDVSVGPTLGAAAVASAGLLSHGDGIVLAVIVPILLGGFIGMVNGILVARVGVSSFILTLATGTLTTGIVTLATNAQPISSGIPDSVTNFGFQLWLGIPKVVWVVVVVAAILWFVLTQTLIGRYLYSVGSNPSAARLVGMRVERTILLSFVASGALSAVAGVILLTATGSADPTIGPGYTLPALSAGFLGATTILPGRFNVLGTLVGLIFIALSVNGLTLAGAAGWVSDVFYGGALIMALVLSTTLTRFRQGN